MSVGTQYPHIVRDEKGTPAIEGTSLKVIELVVERIAYGWSPEELHFQHPYLTLGQIYSALAYHSDHAEAMDREITERVEKVEATKREARGQPSQLRARLRGQRPR